MRHIPQRDLLIPVHDLEGSRRRQPADQRGGGGGAAGARRGVGARD